MSDISTSCKQGEDESDWVVCYNMLRLGRLLQYSFSAFKTDAEERDGEKDKI
jgi:hypothetical protein